MTHWCRLWEDMPTDTKWRTVAKRAGRPVSEVLAVFVHMMTNAANATERGTIESWNDEDVALAIDAEPEHVTAIREAMQGKTLDGNHLTGWEKRQPVREDGSAERAKAWRERNSGPKNGRKRPETQTSGAERSRTQPNAQERPDKIREDKIEEESCPKPDKAARTKISYPEDLDLFWEGYPTHKNMTKSEMLKEWVQLSDQDRQAAIDSLPAFRQFCRDNPTYTCLHACRYLSRRRFEAYQPRRDPSGAPVRELGWAQTA